jgi:hypothetical protein
MKLAAAGAAGDSARVRGGVIFISVKITPRAKITPQDNREQ